MMSVTFLDALLYGGILIISWLGVSLGMVAGL